MFTFSITNQSASVTAEEIAAWLIGIQAQCDTDFSPIWGTDAKLINTVQAGAFPVYVQDNSDAQGALGYHDIDDNGVPYVKVFAVDSATAGVPLSSVVSHEILEVLADPYVESTALVDYGNGKGRIYVAEVCDPVEQDLYISAGVQVSNFVTPWWFDPVPPAGAKLDFAGKLTAPFTVTSGGYCSYRNIGRRGLQGWQQVAGDKAAFWGGPEDR